MKLRHLILILLPLLLATVIAGLCFGSASLSFSQLVDAFAGRGEESIAMILWQLRLPRVVAGLLAGLGLSTAGILLQSVTGNALASPSIIGINSGAGLAVIALLTVFPAVGKLLPVGAFFGAFGVAAVIVLMAQRLVSSRSGILLTGIAVTTILNSFISFLSLLDENAMAQYNYFTVGSLKGVRFEELLLPAVIILASFCAALLLSRWLGLLCLGDAAASALGIGVKELRITALALAAASSAAVVSFAGLLGFVGLVVPHIAKGLTSQQPRVSLPVAALCGSILVLFGDLLGRTLFAPSELPVGILMSLVGGPYFLILLSRRKHHAAGA